MGGNEKLTKDILCVCAYVQFKLHNQLFDTLVKKMYQLKLHEAADSEIACIR